LERVERTDSGRGIDIADVDMLVETPDMTDMTDAGRGISSGARCEKLLAGLSAESSRGWESTRGCGSIVIVVFVVVVVVDISWSTDPSRPMLLMIAVAIDLRTFRSVSCFLRSDLARGGAVLSCPVSE